MTPSRARGWHAARLLVCAFTAVFAGALCSWAGGEKPLLLDKAYLKTDTTFSGTVHIRGQCVIKRGATLTILPGTEVKFLWTDEDNNGIGDGELTVEGRLIASGTREKPIRFTSGRDKPAPKDWTFVQISVSKDSVVENAVFEYAFTGLQIHYSTATVRDSLFTGNYEGMRFSTADVMIEHNDFNQNGYGIRYEANGSRTIVRKNSFTGNGVAFFPVRKCWDSVKISENNVTGTKTYNVKLGQTQDRDIVASENWWGTADREAIAESLFDKRKDAALGKVVFEPYLAAPVADAGRRR